MPLAVVSTDSIAENTLEVSKGKFYSPNLSSRLMYVLRQGGWFVLIESYISKQPCALVQGVLTMKLAALCTLRHVNQSWDQLYQTLNKMQQAYCSYPKSLQSK